MTAPQRIQLRRTAGWRKPEGAIVVARPTRWGNPYVIDDYRPDWPAASNTELRRMAVSDFRGMVDGRWAEAFDYPSIAEIRSALSGHDLGCWCPLDQPCHGDVLLELANRGTA